MSAYGEGKINESCKKRHVTGFCLQLSPWGSMGLIGPRSGGWPSFLPFFFPPQSTAVVCLWSVASSVVAEHESDFLYLYQSSVLSLHGFQGRFGISLAVNVGASEEHRHILLSVFISWEYFFSCSYREKENNRECAFMLQRKSSGVTVRWEVERGYDSPPSLVERDSKGWYGPHLCIISSGRRPTRHQKRYN